MAQRMAQASGLEDASGKSEKKCVAEADQRKKNQNRYGFIFSNLGKDGALPYLYNQCNRTYNILYYFGHKKFGRLWPNQYLGAVYPGVIPHKRAKGYRAALIGHSTLVLGKSVGTFNEAEPARIVQDSSIREFADSNGGICTFWICGFIPIIYITDYNLSVQLLDDKFCRIPLNESLTGIPPAELRSILNQENRKKILGHMMDADCLSKVTENSISVIQDFMSYQLNRPLELSKFVHTLVEAVESSVLFDLQQKPLSEYNKDPRLHSLFYEYLERIIDFSMNQSMQKRLAQEYDEFMIQILKDNFKSLSKNPHNVLRKMYGLEGVPFPQTPDGFHKQGDEEKRALKMCFGIICGASVNTSNAINWVIRHIENNLALKEKVIKEARSVSLNHLSTFQGVQKHFPTIRDVVLESLRFTPILPGLGKLVRQPHTLKINGKEIYVNKNTLILIDVLKCNRGKHYVNPDHFDLRNISELRKKDDNLFSFLNSDPSFRTFGGGFNVSNSGKCPGRFFTIALQVSIIANLYRNYSIQSKNISLKMKNKAPLQVHMLPEDEGTVFIQKL